MNHKLKAWATGKGRLAVLDIAELAETSRYISGLEESGQLDGRLFRTYLSSLVLSASTPEPRWRSIILLSVPRPAHQLIFERDSGPFKCFIPPTYVGYRKLSGMLLKDLRTFMGRDLPKTAILRAPLKRLAVRSGLAAYGRNNITYSGEYGSYHQLLGFLGESEIAPFCSDGPVENPQLPACARCSACARRCPTQAIDRERFLIHAEKCFTLFTENPGRLPPVRDKLAGEMLCLAGCLACQTVCPVNKGKLKIELAPVSFTAAETKHLLDVGGKRGNPVYEGIRKKLKILGMLHYQNRIGRNLRFIMNISN
ncbi:MAG: 4Fe-4S double cluster binding domain-containing protein [Chrysiogenia bacterium]